MSQSRLEIKVGLYVAFCLALVAVLLLQFSKGTTFFRSTYNVTLKAVSAGGLKNQAAVLMSGVQVGTVSGISLTNEGANVTINLTIYGEHSIKDDARFVIEQSGFLGDQYIAVYPEKHQGAPLKGSSKVMPVQEPFNLQEVARSASGFIRRMDDTARNLNDAIGDVRRNVLNEKTLTNLAHTIDTLQKVSDSAAAAVDNINELIKSNVAPATAAVSNLLTFSDRLNAFARSAQGILDTNQPQINLAVSNLQTSTAMLKDLVHQAETGKGLAGALLRNEQLAVDISNLASNLNVFAGNLRSNSLFHTFFRKPKEPESKEPPPSKSQPPGKGGN